MNEQRTQQIWNRILVVAFVLVAMAALTNLGGCQGTLRGVGEDLIRWNTEQPQKGTAR